MPDPPVARSSSWQGEKKKPSYGGRQRLPPVFRSRTFRITAVFVFIATAITLILFLAGGREEHDIDKATKEYNDYLASAQHKKLIYPDPEDRAHGNAAIIALVRNGELDQMVQSMRELEETFNRKFKYPWIFFNDVPFSERFKRITSSLTDAVTQYGTLSCII
jgi:hypothetical protein